MHQKSIVYSPRKDIPEYLPIFCKAVGHHVLQNFHSKTMKSKFWILYWVVKGQGAFQIENASIKINKGQALLISPQCNRRLLIDNSLFECYSIKLIGYGLKKLELDLSPAGPSPFDAGNCPMSDFLQLFETIQDLSEMGGSQSSVLAYQILLKAFGKYKVTSNINSPVKKAITIIQSSLSSSKLNVNDLANQMKMHRNSLNRIFQKELGISPIEYITQRRLQKAMKSLKEEHFSVSHIANACGFDSSDYFCRLFRKHIGMTPSEFRIQV